jgi:hypothetical protein
MKPDEKGGRKSGGKIDDLALVLDCAFRALAEGASDPGSGWRNMALGTVGASGQPRIRTVVLRGFDPLTRMLDIHTDARSAKMPELASNPHVALHGWKPASGEQLRVEGPVRVHAGDAVARGSWDGLRPASRETYRVLPGPGSRIGAPEEASPAQGDAAAFAVFVVLRLRIERLDYLRIAHGGHRRACFDWSVAPPASMWLVP